MKYQLFSLLTFSLGGPWFLEKQCSQFFYQFVIWNVDVVKKVVETNLIFDNQESG